MLKETETEETIGFLPRFYHWWHFNWGGGGGPLGHTNVARIFDLGVQTKPQITCNDVIRNFERGIFVGAKIS